MISLAQTPVVQMRGITKRFGHVVANSKVDLDVYEGEILSLLGENGSGKTTLMNMLSGIYFPDEGQILVHGREVTIASPKDAFDLRIGMIHQHFKLVDVFTAVENIALGLEGKLMLDKREVAAKVKEICDKYGFDVDPNQKVYNMSVSQKQTLEIVKVLYRGADILILDEPTAVLTPQETEKLFAVLRNMKADGKSVIIITHKLHEVMSVSDRVAVLRKGEFIGDVATKDTNPQELTNMMVGRPVSLNIARPTPKDPKPRLVVSHLNVSNSSGVQVLKDICFTANSGEILGIAGISGCGQKELLESVAGLQATEKGSSIIYIEPDTGREDELIGQSPKQIRDKGVALSFVPEDRLGMGLVGDMNLPANMMLKTYGEGHGLLVNRKAPLDLANEVVEQLEVVTPDVFTPVRKLSGGNVQKILVGRELAANPSVLMTAYAVRGLDINTSYAIYDLLNQQKEKGCAVIYVGEDLDVLLELCDRILVLCAGQVNGILDGPSATKEQVGLLMTNLQKGGADHV